MFLRRSLLAVFASLAIFTLASSAADKPKRLLLVTHSGGFVHDSVAHAETVLKEIGPKNGFEVTCFRFTGDPEKVIKYSPKKGEPPVEKPWLAKYAEEFRAKTGATVEKENIGRVNKETLKN